MKTIQSNQAKKLLIVSGFLLSFLPCWLQAQSKVRFYVDYHYLIGITEKGDVYNLSRKDSKMGGNLFHLSATYAISKTFEAGVGIGIDGYTNPNYTSFPVFATLHYAFLPSVPHVYTYTHIGYAFETTASNSGIVWDLGIGYKKMFRPHFGLNFQAGYNLKSINGNLMWDDKKIGTVTQNRNSVGLGFGFIF